VESVDLIETVRCDGVAGPISWFASSLLVHCFWQFGASVEDFQIAVIREKPMALFAGRLTNHAEL
jgi:hypothetical protein